MKITIEKDIYDHATESFKTTTIVYETTEVSLFESFQYLNKLFSIISVNGKYDWKDRMFDGFYPTGIDAAAPVIHPAPVVFPAGVYPGTAIPSWPWTPMQPLIGDPIDGSDVCTRAKTVASAMTQADGQGDDSGTRGD